MGDESGKRQPEDLELTPTKADDVKGGVRPPEMGGGTPRQVAVKHQAHKQIKGPSGGMTHK